MLYVSCHVSDSLGKVKASSVDYVLGLVSEYDKLGIRLLDSSILGKYMKSCIIKYYLYMCGAPHL